MSKLVWIIIAAIVVIAGVGGVAYYKLSHHESEPAVKEEHGGVFNSIQDAVMKSLSLKCDYSQDEKTQVIAYIKNGQVRSDVTVKNDPANSGHAIIKVSDKKIYFWNNQNMGFVMTLPDVSVTPSQEADKSSSVQNMWESLEKYKDHCKPATIADSLFVLPTNIKFQDMTQMMHTMPSGVPTGTSGSTSTYPTGGYAIPTQYQQYMQHAAQ